MKSRKPQTLDFFGRSMAMPYNVESQLESGKTQIVEGEDHIRQIISMIFRTRKFTRPMRRRLGFSNNSIVFQPILSSLRSQVEYHLKKSLSSFGDDRIDIKSVGIDWSISKGSAIYFFVHVYDKTEDKSYTISHLWDYMR